MRLSPVTLLGLWIAFAFALPALGPASLPWLGLAALPACLDQAGRRRLRLLLRRSRLLFFALILIHAFGAAGPGTSVPLWPEAWISPSRAGLEAGLLQAARLLLLLTTLAWVLARLERDGLLAGLYGLLRPLAAVGVPVERFTVRLALVLEWSDANRPSAGSTAALLQGLDAPPPAAGQRVGFDLQPPGWRDAAALLVFVLGLVAVPK